MARARYDGLAEEYRRFVADNAGFYEEARRGLVELLGTGSGPALDLGCGTGQYLGVLRAAGFEPVGVDASADQLRVAAEAHPDATLVRADAGALPFPDRSFAVVVSMFTHTDLDDFRSALGEARRVLRPGGRLVYVGNHPCFVGPVQENRGGATLVLHPGYRTAGRWSSEGAPGPTPGGWRARLGSFVHLPLDAFLNAFAGLVLERVVELDDAAEYPRTIALAFRRP